MMDMRYLDFTTNSTVPCWVSSVPTMRRYAEAIAVQVVYHATVCTKHLETLRGVPPLPNLNRSVPQYFYLERLLPPDPPNPLHNNPHLLSPPLNIRVRCP